MSLTLWLSSWKEKNWRKKKKHCSSFFFFFFGALKLTFIGPLARRTTTTRFQQKQKQKRLDFGLGKLKAQEKPKIIEVTLGLFAQLPSWGLLLHKMGSKVQIFFTSSQAQGLLLYKIDLNSQLHGMNSKSQTPTILLIRKSKFTTCISVWWSTCIKSWRTKALDLFKPPLGIFSFLFFLNLLINSFIPLWAETSWL